MVTVLSSCLIFSQPIISCGLFLAIAAALHVFKLIYILTKKDKILSFLDDICVHSFNDVKEFNEVQQKLNNFAKFGYAYNFFMAFGVSCFQILSLPIFSSEVTLPLKIGFPLDWRNSRTNYWLAHAFIATGVIAAATVSSFTIIYWYIMLNCSMKYKMLGNQLRSMGKKKERKELFSQQFVQLIETHRNIRKYFCFFFFWYNFRQNIILHFQHNRQCQIMLFAIISGTNYYQ